MENRGIAFLTVRRCVLCLFVLYILILPTQSQAGILSCDDIVKRIALHFRDDAVKKEEKRQGQYEAEKNAG